MFNHGGSNRAYRLIWNRAKGRWIVAPERARGGGMATTAVSAVALLAMIGTAEVAKAEGLPTGGQVVAGQITIGTQGNSMTVDQGSARGIINWQGFDIAAGSSVTFRQPDASAVTLNRITGGSGTTIAGRIDANGKVYIVNPNGVLFTQGAQVNVGGLVAAAGDIADTDFLAGIDKFTMSGAAVINQGALAAADGGAVVLLGGTVSNQGSIKADGGDAILAAGSTMRLDAGAGGHLKIEVDGATTATLVENGGLIAANGGQVVMTAQGASAAIASVVSNSGTIEAQTLDNKAGTILLLADMEGGETKVGGTLDASAPVGGDGGFIETSAARVSIDPQAAITTKASAGATGTWLIDPYDITISSSASNNVSVVVGSSPWQVTPTSTGSNINNSTLATYLASSNVTISTVGAGSEAGNITVSAAVSWSAATTLSLIADASTGGIFINANITGSNASSGLTLSAGSGGISQAGGATIRAGTLQATAANGGSISLTNSGNLVGTLGTSSAAGSFAFTNGQALTVSGPVASNGTLSLITTVGDLTINGAISDSHANSSLTLTAAGNLIIAKNITQSGTNAAASLNYGGSYSLTNGARLSLSDSGASLSIGGTSYTLIHDVAGLQAMAVGTNYALANDIDASATSSWNSGAGFAAIDSYANTFAGLGHIIDSLTINRPSNSQQGLFGIMSGTARDVTLSNVSVSGNGTVGSIVARLSGGTITNVHVTGSVAGASGLVGGLVGWNDIGSISLSSSAASVSGAGEVGGLVGRNRAGSITASYATGSVTSTSSGAGGLVGTSVQGSTLTDVYASGLVTGSTGTGGLVGSQDASSITASNAYWDSNTTGQSTSAAGTSITSANARTQSTYAGFDFTNTWVMIAGETRPMLRNEYSSVIATPAALQLMSLNLAGSYTLGANLNLTSAFTADSNGYYAGLWGASGFAPVGNNSTSFTGSFDGQSHTITGLTINRSTTNYVGLFGYTNSATISNIKLTGGSISGNDDVGPLIGYMLGGSVSSATASATVSGASTGEVNSGGLIGAVDAGAVSGSSAGSSVTGAGYNIGGLVGYLVNGGTITQSYATGNVTGTGSSDGYVGGLVGGNGYAASDGGTISRSYATGTVTGARGPVGGLVGHNEGTITDSYATGRVIGLAGASNIGGFVGVNFTHGVITNAYSTGYVTGSSLVGGFAGYNNNSASAITNAYWDTQTSGQSGGIAGGSGSITGRTTAQLQGSLPAGFSSAIWGTGTNLYPYFGWNYSTTPVAVTGVAYSDAGTTSLVGATVTALSGGSAIGSAVTGGNGYYYILGTASSLASSGVLTYIDNGATKGAAFSDNAGTNGIQNLSIYGTAAHIITGQSTLTATRTNYLAALGSYSDTDLSFLSSANFAPLTTTAGYGVYLDTSGNYTLNTNLGSSGLLTINSGGTFGVSGTVTLSAAGALTIADAVSWSDGSSLTVSTTSSGNISLGGAVTGTSGTLIVNAGGTATTASAVDVSAFNLASGTWSQIATTLSSFSATSFSLTSGTTFLRVTGGDGAAATPYQIADLYGLQGVGSTSLLSQNFVLTADINATPTSSWNSGTGFASIGGSSTAFTGSFDGGGYTIGGLVVNRPTIAAGLFGSIGSSGSVSNLTVAGSVKGLSAGMLVGDNSGSISDVTTYGSVGNSGAASAGSLGGLAGQNTGTISGSKSSASITASSISGSNVGGLVGSNTAGATISGSSATGAVTNSGTSSGAAGGLVGSNAGSVSNAYATGSVTGYYGGGLSGQNSGTITNTYATGAISGGQYSGGHTGDNSGTIANSYSTGAVTSSTVAGGLIGNNAGTITDSFWNTTSSSNLIGVGAGSGTGATGRTTAQMNSLSTFTGAGWSIDDAGGTSSVWRIYDGYTAPLLRSFLSSLTITGGSGTKTYDGSASSTSVGTLVYNPSGYTTSLVSGTASYTANSANAGSYSGSNLTLSGLYSSQLGYDITFVAGTLVIDKAALTVTASNASKTYDGGAFSGGNGVSYSGFVNGETASVLGGTLSYGGTAQGAVNAGTYTLSASGLTATNYTISYTAGQLTINPAALAVSANNASKTYDGTGYSGGNGVTYSGFVNGETASVLGGTLSYGGTAQGATDVGDYIITAWGLLSNNYTISFEPGTLTIARSASDGKENASMLALATKNILAEQAKIASMTDNKIKGKNILTTLTILPDYIQLPPSAP